MTTNLDPRLFLLAREHIMQYGWKRGGGFVHGYHATRPCCLVDAVCVVHNQLFPDTDPMLRYAAYVEYVRALKETAGVATTDQLTEMNDSQTDEAGQRWAVTVLMDTERRVRRAQWEQ